MARSERRVCFGHCICASQAPPRPWISVVCNFSASLYQKRRQRTNYFLFLVCSPPASIAPKPAFPTALRHRAIALERRVMRVLHNQRKHPLIVLSPAKLIVACDDPRELGTAIPSRLTGTCARQWEDRTSSLAARRSSETGRNLGAGRAARRLAQYLHDADIPHARSRPRPEHGRIRKRSQTRACPQNHGRRRSPMLHRKFR